MAERDVTALYSQLRAVATHRAHGAIGQQHRLMVSTWYPHAAGGRPGLRDRIVEFAERLADATVDVDSGIATDQQDAAVGAGSSRAGPSQGGTVPAPGPLWSLHTFPGTPTCFHGVFGHREIGSEAAQTPTVTGLIPFTTTLPELSMSEDRRYRELM
ncbi:hypothetical protein [Amycolatopsis sp. lyj-108]|uniref:hypothetical protein n=1 Tax=Amycolatopsis sp. lyj-108 TaxID=2789286 RepID=UPI00397A4B70